MNGHAVPARCYDDWSLEIKRLRAEVARLTKAGPGEPESGRTSSSRKGGASSSKTRAEIPSQAADLNLNLKEILVRVLQGEEAGTMPGGAAAPTTTVRVSEDNAKKLHTNRLMMAHFSALGVNQFVTPTASTDDVHRWARAMVQHQKGLPHESTIIFEGNVTSFNKKPTPFAVLEQALEGRVLGQKGGLTAVHILGELDVMCHEYTGMEEITFKTNLPAVTCSGFGLKPGPDGWGWLIGGWVGRLRERSSFAVTSNHVAREGCWGDAKALVVI